MKNKKRSAPRNDPYGAGQAGFGRRNNKGGPAFSMGQRPVRNTPNDPTNTVLYVRNIPEEYLDEEKVSSFFSKFGVLEKIELNLEQHAAILTFTSHEAAHNAWSSPEPIFNNRFIKIFWYNPNKASQSRPASRKDFFQASSRSPDLENHEDEEDPSLLLQNEDFHKDIAEKQKLHEERMKRLEENKKALEELNERKQQLALQQLEQQRLLMSKIKEADPENKNKSQLLETQLAVLKAEAESLGIPVGSEGSQSGRSTNHHPSSSAPSQRGSSAYRGRGRGGFSLASMSIDNRPTRVKVKNLTPEKNESLLQFVFSVGEYESIDGLNPDERLVNFQNRKAAERFYHGVLRIPSLKDVQLEWVGKDATKTLQTQEDMMEDGNQ
ncbi:RNA-binding protein [Schizosaccharomyces cryophilus OY26]|uniref:RNA-binding protein n=1 Tax=Schizosaccharomyces cryophilus (strain OY26 / ATCC MYA-4695 / CBS 11777 / NBRC 106824 / NRRL Y48691) TaxID=653667 RepID=S9X9S6_SCHCR|nr:RNA-binding protein [Schizosaccharomyces cryophilus OY26]EPY50521.1 RNA-binding protein [Schizosaccharomyces cryophilus OY26]